MSNQLRLIRSSYRIHPSPINQLEVWQIYSHLKERYKHMSVPGANEPVSLQWSDFKIPSSKYYGERDWMNVVEFTTEVQSILEKRSLLMALNNPIEPVGKFEFSLNDKDKEIQAIAKEILEKDLSSC